VTSQVVLSKNGIDPEFRIRQRLSLNVEETIGEPIWINFCNFGLDTHIIINLDTIIEKSKEFGVSANADVNNELKKKLDVATVTKQEADAKVHQCFDKIEELFNEIALLRKHVRLPIVHIKYFLYIFFSHD